MKNILNNKFIAWFVGILIVGNLATLTFFWIGHLKNQSVNSPKEFLAKKLEFSEAQKKSYFKLAEEHNEAAKLIRDQIKFDKENLFKLLKSDTVNDSVRNDAAAQVSSSIQSLDILTFEHFKKVRAICTKEQKQKFDEIIQKMVNSVNQPQKAPPPTFQESEK